MSRHAEQIRTQALMNCMSAMGAAEVRIYGNDPEVCSGVVLHDDRTLWSETYWAVAPGERKRIRVVVRVTVEEEPL
jgi:hypothetical protein